MKQHVTIFREPGRYAGWPANYGIWSWGDEIVVGYTLGYHKTDSHFHARDTSKPFVTIQARSLDGGLSWQNQDFPGRTPGNRGLSADEHMNAGMGVGDVLDQDNAPVDPPGDIDFSHPNFALMCARTGLKAGATSFFYVSYDRCHSWQGPYKLPMFGQTGIAARTDYLISGKDECFFFLTANKKDGQEGRVICIRTTDGGKSFDFVSWIGEEPSGDGFAIMPASIRLSNSHILTAVRCRGSERQGKQGITWIDLYRSVDNGQRWQFLNRPVMFKDVDHNGNPGSLTQLHDGRLALIFGNRDAPFTICAKLSNDNGESWGDWIVLREGGGSYDIGYPRTTLRPDGTIVTVYYFNDRPDGERFLEATLWKP